jgi:hypothetical protein
VVRTVHTLLWTSHLFKSRSIAGHCRVHSCIVVSSLNIYLFSPFHTLFSLSQRALHSLVLLKSIGMYARCSQHFQRWLVCVLADDVESRVIFFSVRVATAFRTHNHSSAGNDRASSVRRVVSPKLMLPLPQETYCYVFSHPFMFSTRNRSLAAARPTSPNPHDRFYSLSGNLLVHSNTTSINNCPADLFANPVSLKGFK